MLKWSTFFGLHGLIISLIVQDMWLKIDPPRLAWCWVGIIVGALFGLLIWAIFVRPKEKAGHVQKV